MAVIVRWCWLPTPIPLRWAKLVARVAVPTACSAKGLREIHSRHKLSLTSSFVSSHLIYCISCRLVRLEDIKVL